MKKTINFIFTASVALMILSGCAGESKPQESEEDIAKKSYVEKQTVKVSVEKVRKGDFARELISNGKLMAKEKAVVPFRVQELISTVKVKNGRRVKKGELLAQLEPYKYRKQLDDSRDRYEKARIDLEDQLLGYGYSITDTAKVRSNLLKMAKIRSGYNQALSNLNEAKRNYADTRIVAPINGVVANLEAQANNLSSQYKNCCEVINDRVLLVEFPVLEGEISQIKKGQSIEIIPFALKNSSYKGIVTAINPTIDEHGMITIQAEVNKSHSEMMDGMNVKVLVKNEKPNCIIIPKTAVLYRQNRKVVFVHEDGIAKWVYVEIGLENSSEVTITDNSLKPGQEVIVSNNINLAHETPVAVNEAH